MIQRLWKLLWRYIKVNDCDDYDADDDCKKDAAVKMLAITLISCKRKKDIRIREQPTTI